LSALFVSIRYAIGLFLNCRSITVFSGECLKGETGRGNLQETSPTYRLDVSGERNFVVPIWDIENVASQTKNKLKVTNTAAVHAFSWNAFFWCDIALDTFL
jgi:hypothetical protein